MENSILKTKSGVLSLPAFFPDATKAVIKGVAADDLARCQIDGLVVNTYHLMNENLVDTINQMGGIHKFMGFNWPVISDSGGFQVMSLIRENPRNGEITDSGIFFKPSKHVEAGHVFTEMHLSPKSCIETQIKLGSDIIMCLDDCTNIKEPVAEQEKSMERTIKWAQMCKDEFERLTAGTKPENKPLLFAIVQGGNVKELRKKCAEALIKIGFDGYAYGGWPVDADHNFLTDIVDYTCKLIPDDKPKYAMGVGKPKDIIACKDMGYNMFDCVLPTRDARHRRLYVFNDAMSTDYTFINMDKAEHKLNSEPVSGLCDCETCKNYSRGYLYHLFKIKDMSAIRLATIHNLRFYSVLMERLRV